MPIGTDGLFTRVWRFIDQFAETDRIRRQDMDTALDDIVVGVNQAILLSQQYDDVADAAAASIPAAVLRISTAAYDSSVSASGGGGSYVRSSASGVSGYPTRAWFTSADGAYWLLDDMSPSPKQFGCVGGAVFSTQTGSDDAAGFAHYLDYLNATGRVGLIDDYYMLQSGDFLTEGVMITADGAGMQGIGKGRCGISVTVGAATAYPTGTYSQSGTTITVTITAHGASVSDLRYLDFKTGTASDGWFTVASVADADTFTVTAAVSATTSGNVTMNAFPVDAAGVRPLADNVILRDMEIEVRQISTRPSDRGQWGANICCGYFGYDGTQPEYTGMLAENLRLTRAARGGFSVEHGSDYSVLGQGISVIGNFNDSIARNIDVVGDSTVKMLTAVQWHWGCSAVDPTGNPGETYHPHGWIVDLASVENTMYGATISSAYDIDLNLPRMDALEATGLYILPGDNSDAYAVSRDAGKANTGIRVNQVVGSTSTNTSNPRWVEIAGVATSKWENDADDVDYLKRFPIMDIKIGTVNGTLTGGAANADCVSVTSVRGSLKIGPITESGFTRRALGVYNTGDGHIDYEVINSEQGVYIYGAGSFIGRGNDCAPEYSDSDTGGLSIIGYQADIGTNAATLSAGDTTMQLALASTDEVFPGDLLIFGGNEVRATSHVEPGMTTVNFEPIINAVGSTGQTVTVKSTPRGTAQPNVKKARYGVRVNLAEVDFYGMGPTGCGQYAYRIESGAVADIGKAWPRQTGMNSGTTTNYDLYLADDALATVDGARIGAGGSHVEAHIYVSDEGFVALNGCRYEGSNTLITTETANDRGRFTLNGLVDTAGTQQDVDSSGDAIDKYGTWTPAVEFGGASTGITYSAQGGNYRINGNEMTVDFDVTLSAKGSATGNATISGLPDPWPSVSTDDLGPAFMSAATGLGGGAIFLTHLSGELALNEQTTTTASAVDDTNATSTTRIKGKMTVPIGA